ncbi:MAG: 3-deoxy-8-phosphooctulonate synthase [Deltaproteobacteria bacterium]|nr:3-deoxy-8-phosphooctulonate synthase [Deltaproteobacteria bacterium]
MIKGFHIDSHQVGGGAPLLVMAGPCVLETMESALATARFVADTLRSLHLGYVFKASYDKANRTSINSYRGPGLKDGLAMLTEIKRRTGIPVMSDVHEVAQVEAAAEVLDVIQIPAFLCRQTDLVVAVARTGKVVNIKKGQFLSPWDVAHIIDKVLAAGNDRIMITERGASFGYRNLVVDMRSLPIMRSFGYPVIFDATHSVQLPGGGQGVSSGDRTFIPPLARAAVAAGVDGLFFEVHPQPDLARCDGPNSLPLEQFAELISHLNQIDRLIKPALEKQ